MTFYLQGILLVFVIYFALYSRTNVSVLTCLMPVLWFVGVSTIYWRYGPVGQWSFYQNDQYFHWKIVSQGYGPDFNLTFDRLNFFRVPYTISAYALSKIGFDATLALKFVSLVCALSTVSLIEKRMKVDRVRFTISALWLTASPIIIFFSLLALRETMMALCVTHLFLGSSHPRKMLSMIVLVILRPHLAAAIGFGLLWGWMFSHLRSRWYLTGVLATAILPIYVGVIGFSVGNFIIYRLPLQLYQSVFLRDQVIQVFSAFVGLQFLTVAYQTVEFTTRSLVLIRLIFPEIVLVPLLFTVSCLVNTPRTNRLKLSVLATFVFFVAVSSGTEYLSVRQSLPMMPIMGLAMILSFSRGRGSECGAERTATSRDALTRRVESSATS